MKPYTLLAVLLNAFMFVDLLATSAGATAIPAYVLGGDTFTLVSPNRDAGDPLNALPTELPATGHVPVWDATNVVFGGDSDNGYVQSSDGTAAMGYIEGLHSGEGYPFAQYWFVQADIDFSGETTAATSALLGFMGEAEIPGRPFESQGEIWVEYKADGGWIVYAGGSILGSGLVAPAAGFGNSVRVDWDIYGNSVSASINGTSVLYGASIASSGIDPYETYGFAFQLHGNAKLDNYAALPEPSSVVLLSLGGVGIVAQLYRKRRSTRLAGRDLAAALAAPE